ncbi:MFS transporter [Mesobacterium sp. TK19101]|uniref:MFS transporter n=1 Tax=Mesobacterium hydrothermale TaxID=3111907 RepID=A0ABU6HC17_9RHOB|nr:MFS transporter [Mesobacterium sp. TK19101]MEC3859936.1 MFS transporter [Mesobacterium sp. TK19101]
MPSLSIRLFDTLTGQRAEDATEAENGLRHMVCLSMTKVADGLIDPKLVLSWLFHALGVPPSLTALLVPIREAGALLPQLLLAGLLRRMVHRKWVWALGALGQGLSAAVIAACVLTLDGVAAGGTICCALAVLAICRAASSVSYKDVLGKTVAKARRGAVTGVAGSASALAVLVYAGLMLSGQVQGVVPLALAVALAALLWSGAGLLFAGLKEDASARHDAGPHIDLSPLRQDAQFRRYIAVRGALTATALAPPFLVMLSPAGGALQSLGALVLASAAASFVSSYFWGRLADRSARLVLAGAGFSGAVALALGALAGITGQVWALPGVLFILMLAYHGVRQGRSVYLVDMSPADKRADYAALANTVIGTVLLLVGALGGGLSLLGPVETLLSYAGLCLLGGVLALGLSEVERDG